MKNTGLRIITGSVILFCTYLTSLYSFLLFHTLVEIFSILIGFGIFLITWNTRRLLDNNYLMFLGLAYLFIGGLDLFHTLAYKGMNIFTGYGPNLATALWIAARYLQGFSFLIAPYFLGKKLKPLFVLSSYGTVTGLFLISIFYWGIFPVCYVDGIGLTPFKIISEYIISTILLLSIILLLQKKADFDLLIIHYLIASLLLSVGAELMFTFYIGVYDFSNIMGHLLKLLSSYFLYKAIIETGLTKPYSLLFRSLKQREGDLEFKKNEAEEAMVQAKSANRAKSDFLANMSHELWTPLNSIIGFTEVLLDQLFGKQNEKQITYLKNIYSSGRHLLKLINDILDLSKVEAGKMELESSRFPLKQVLEASLTMLKEKAITHNIKINLEITPDADQVIEADERRLKQILFNLLSNAVKFTPDGGSVRLTAKRIRSGESGVWSKGVYGLHTKNIEPDIDFIEISIEDNGIGIKKEDLSRLFKEFTQLESVYSKNHEGTGLGLALTKRLVELHGGRIRVASEGEGKGCRFWFEIPLERKIGDER
ncbi:MAG: hybrid sensor histidine kinase/response regulator [Deltaproteobacteria bacterium]|nr:hybrid sensor histidine kinase/response regulator [Deltaproteobacteria bacterium]